MIMEVFRIKNSVYFKQHILFKELFKYICRPASAYLQEIDIRVTVFLEIPEIDL